VGTGPALDDGDELWAAGRCAICRARTLDDRSAVRELDSVGAEIRDHDEPIGVNLEVPRRLVAERAQGRAAALRIGPRHLARIRATVRERSAGDLERRELALVPVDRFAVLVAH